MAAWIAPLLAGGFSALGQRRANKAAREEAQKNREFQLYMSNTAHQREVKDLRAAGLNPILSATGGPGASTGSGAMAQQRDEIGPAVGSAMAARRLKQDLRIQEAQEKLLTQQEYKTRVEADKAQYEASLARTDALFASATLDKRIEQQRSTAAAVDYENAKRQAEAVLYETALGPVLRILEKFGVNVNSARGVGQDVLKELALARMRRRAKSGK